MMKRLITPRFISGLHSSQTSIFHKGIREQRVLQQVGISGKVEGTLGNKRRSNIFHIWLRLPLIFGRIYGGESSFGASWITFQRYWLKQTCLPNGPRMNPGGSSRLCCDGGAVGRSRPIRAFIRLSDGRKSSIFVLLLASCFFLPSLLSLSSFLPSLPIHKRRICPTWKILSSIWSH